MSALFEVEGLVGGYEATQVLHGLSLRVEHGGVTALLGANGAGKTTLMNTLAGLPPAREGTVRLLGEDITRSPSNQRVLAGMVLVPEERFLFPSMTVRENLRLGAINPRARAHWQRCLDHVCHVFPRLLARESQSAVVRIEPKSYDGADSFTSPRGDSAMKQAAFPQVALAAAAVLTLGVPLTTSAVEPASLRNLAARSPAPPWPAGDERGMANVLGEATTQRCGWHMTQRGARTYEASFERSNTMPKSPFAPPSLSKPKPTAGVPFSAHAFNSEAFEAGAEPQQQGTQIDAIGHFASIKAPWDPKEAFAGSDASYYGGFKQQDVKPTPDSPLLKLGIEKIPPLVTTAVLLDARAHIGKGRSMTAGALVTAADIDAMLKAQGLSQRGILPGDMVWIYTGWSEHWKDPADTASPYYGMAPGLAVDAAKMLAGKRIVAIGLDAPFIDAVPEGMLQGKAPPAPGTEPGLPFSIHHYMLSVYGIHHLENLNLAAMTGDKVWTSCAMVLPSRDKGAAGAVIRPVAIGVPNQR